MVRFRLAAPADASSVLELKRAAIRELAGWHYSAEQIDAWAPDDDALPVFERAIESDRFTVLLAERSDETAGYGVLNGPDQSIDAAYVHPDHTRSGIASRLVGQLETRAQMRSITELKLVSSLNARPFYESLGYWHVGDRTRTVDGVDIDFALMRKQLDANWPS